MSSSAPEKAEVGTGPTPTPQLSRTASQQVYGEPTEEQGPLVAANANTVSLGAESVVSSLSSPAASRRESIVNTPSISVADIYANPYIQFVIETTAANKRTDQEEIDRAKMQPFYEMLEALKADKEASDRFVEGFRPEGPFYNTLPPELQTILKKVYSPSEKGTEKERRGTQHGGGFANSELLQFVFFMLIAYFIGLTAEVSGIGKFVGEYTGRSIPNLLIGGTSDIIVGTKDVVVDRASGFRKWAATLFFNNETTSVAAGLTDWIATIDKKSPGLAIWLDETFIPESLLEKYNQRNKLVTLYSNSKQSNNIAIVLDIAELKLHNPGAIQRVHTNSSYSLYQIEQYLSEYNEIQMYLKNTVRTILGIKDGECYKGSEKDHIRLFDWMQSGFDDSEDIGVFSEIFGTKRQNFAKFSTNYDAYMELRQHIPLFLSSRSIFENVVSIIDNKENNEVTERDQLCLLSLLAEDQDIATKLCGLTVQNTSNETSTSSSSSPLALFVGKSAPLPLTSVDVGSEGTLKTITSTSSSSTTATPSPSMFGSLSASSLPIASSTLPKPMISSYLTRTPYLTGEATATSTTVPTQTIVPTPTTSPVSIVEAPTPAPVPLYIINEYLVGIPEPHFDATEEGIVADLAPIESNEELTSMDLFLQGKFKSLSGSIVKNLAKSLITTNYVTRARLALDQVASTLSNERLKAINAYLEEAKRIVTPYMKPENGESVLDSTTQIVKLLLKEGIVVKEPQMKGLYDAVEKNAGKTLHPEDADAAIRALVKNTEIKFDIMYANYVHGESQDDSWYTFIFDNPHPAHPSNWHAGSIAIMGGVGFFGLVTIYFKALGRYCCSCDDGPSCSLCNRRTDALMRRLNEAPPPSSLGPIADREIRRSRFQPVTNSSSSSSASSGSQEVVTYRPAMPEERELAVQQAVTRGRNRSQTASSRNPALTNAPEPAKFPYRNADDIIQSLQNHSEDFVKRRLALTNSRGLADRIQQAYQKLGQGQTTVGLQATLARYLIALGLTHLIQPNSSSSAMLPYGSHQRKRTYKRKNTRVLTRKRRVA